MSDKPSDPVEQTQVDPKEAMRQALAAKQARVHVGEQHQGGSKVSGGPHKAAAGKRQFRRKAGG
ncbi:MAG: DUF5302 domain-containing protein [Actinomycetia bacterium]|nr:DUF5302 domain-containing protein [Actinomycetes bacterium]